MLVGKIIITADNSKTQSLDKLYINRMKPGPSFRRHDIQHNDIQHNNIQYNDIHHNDIHHNDIQHNGIICDTQHKRLNKMILGISINCHYAECRYAECLYAECLYAECCGAEFSILDKAASYFAFTMK